MSTEYLKVTATPGHVSCRLNPLCVFYIVAPSVPKGQGRARVNTRVTS